MKFAASLQQTLDLPNKETLLQACGKHCCKPAANIAASLRQTLLQACRKHCSKLAANIAANLQQTISLWFWHIPLYKQQVHRKPLSWPKSVKFRENPPHVSEKMQFYEVMIGPLYVPRQSFHTFLKWKCMIAFYMNRTLRTLHIIFNEYFCDYTFTN